MNSWLWKRVFPGLMSSDDGLRLVGVGSLIKKELSYVKGGRKIIFGTGSGYGDFPSQEALKKWIIYFVRGPLTASALGLDRSKSIVDASWLISQLPEYSKSREKKGIIFVPHFASHINSSWNRICSNAEVEYINPLSDSIEVIEAIARAELAVVESLHGAIIADYFRTPWIPVRLSSSTLSFKWQDWCSSVELEYRPYVLPFTDVYHHLLNKKFPRRSNKYYQESHGFLREINVEKSKAVPKDSSPSFVYSSRQLMRRHGKMVANKVREKIITHRDVWPLSIWNSQQEERLLEQLQEILKAEPILSRDSIRSLRLEQLDEKVSELIADYPRLAGF